MTLATSPSFAGAAVNTGHALTPSTADTSLTAPTHTATIITAGSNGTMVHELSFMQVANVAATGEINVFIYDGSTYWLYDQFAYAILSQTASSELARTVRQYGNLLLKSTESLRMTDTTTAGQSAFAVSAFGGDF